MYTREENAALLISALKEVGIRKIIASPGNTNTAFVGSVQNDPFFEVYSCVDERSAAYFATGISVESNEPVVISCTGATASRNYSPGLTEAFYRKIPILAVTSSQPLTRCGHHSPQYIDRSVVPNDVVKKSFVLPIVKDGDDHWHCRMQINRALNLLLSDDPGPIHLNLPTSFELPFDKSTLPGFERIRLFKEPPDVTEIKFKTIAIFVGSGVSFTNDLQEAIDKFCEQFNGAVICDHTSGYKGRYRIQFALVGSQESIAKSQFRPDLLIHVGEISGDYHSMSISATTEVWRVSADGEVRDTFKKLSRVYQMPLLRFFQINVTGDRKETSFYDLLSQADRKLRTAIPELPFSNIWVAQQLSKMLPSQSVVHLGILNTLRSWNFFQVDKTIDVYSNVGGFGIDGTLSTVVGASMVSSEKLYFAILGDLAFYYDINILGNRHLCDNIRIIVINNSKGTEFAQYNHHAMKIGVDVNPYIAAAGHFCSKGDSAAKGFSEAFGFEYQRITSKKEFCSSVVDFLKADRKSKILEIIVLPEDESEALKEIQNIMKDTKVTVKKNIKRILGRK